MADPSTFKQEDQGGNVAVYGPDGTLYKNVPESHLQELVKGGGMPAVRVQGTDGNIHYVPASHTAEVIQGGGKLLPFEQQSVKHPGVWQTIWDNVKSIPESITGPDPLADPRVSDEEKNRLVAEQQAQAAATNEARTKAHGTAYSLGSTAAEMAGAPVAGMEQAAEEGNVRGVVGNMLTAPVVIGAGELVGHGVSKAVSSDFAANLAKNLQEVPEKVRNVTPKQAAQTVGAGVGGVAGHGPLSAPGAYYGAKTAGSMAEAVLGKERANAPIIKPKPPVNPGAPLPANPGMEVLQGNALSTVDQPVKPPDAAALGRIPAAQPSGSAPTVFRGSTQQVAPFKLSDLPPQAVSQAVQELGENAPIAEVKQRAQDIATRKGAAVPETQEQMLARMRGVEQAHGSPAQPQEMDIPDKMPQEQVGAFEETAFGRKPEEIDVGNKIREENPEPGRKELANTKAQEQAKALGELQKPPAEVLNQPLRQSGEVKSESMKYSPEEIHTADNNWEDYSHASAVKEVSRTGKPVKAGYMSDAGTALTPEQATEVNHDVEILQHLSETNKSSHSTLYRGQAYPLEEAPNLQVGGKIQLDSLSGASHNEKFATKYTDPQFIGEEEGKRVLYEIQDADKNSGYDRKGDDGLPETILPKGAKYKITGVKNRPDGITHVTLKSDAGAASGQPIEPPAEVLNQPLRQTTVYHGGTGKGGKYVTYYTPNKEMAQSYVDMSNDRFGGGAKLHESTISIDNPAPEDVINSEAKKVGIDNSGYTPASVFDAELHGEAAVKKLVNALKTKGYDGATLDDIAYGKQIQDKAHIKFQSDEEPAKSQYPPEAPQSKVQPSKPSQADLDETEAIRSRIERQAQAEDNARMRQMRGEYKERNDVSTPKGTLTGAAGEGNDVSLADRSSAAQPDVTKLAKEIATPQQAMRQLENLQKAGASANALADFERRAEVRFGHNWKHIAGQADDLTGILQKSLEQAKNRKPQNP